MADEPVRSRVFGGRDSMTAMSYEEVQQDWDELQVSVVDE